MEAPCKYSCLHTLVTNGLNLILRLYHHVILLNLQCVKLSRSVECVMFITHRHYELPASCIRLKDFPFGISADLQLLDLVDNDWLWLMLMGV